VFLKVLNTETIPEPSIIDRFKREAKILAKLEHPNIIKVLDFGMYRKHFYISFEYFESSNLRELLAKDKLKEEISRDIFVKIVKGLDFAHQKKIIHRDIKPENILVNKDFKVKLTDFGLAIDNIDHFQTQKYSVVGTPAYMSPEQVYGDKLTIQSDLFSLGITALELFGFSNPFFGRDTNDTINKIVSYDYLHFRHSIKNLPDNLKKVFEGLLATKPDERFGSCSEIFELLGITVRPIKSEKKWKRGVILIPLFLLIISGVVYIITFNNKPTESKEIVNPLTNKTDIQSKSTTDDNPNYLQKNQNLEVEQETIDDKSNDQNNLNISTPIHSEDETKTIGNSELYVKCYPWGKLYINNEFVDVTPLEKNITTESGKHLLSIVHPDYPSYQDSIILVPNELSYISINLDTLFGSFDCKVYPWGEVIIDNKAMGITPLQSLIRLGEGKHHLMIKNPTYEIFEADINIRRNDTLSVKINLEEMTLN
jgi:serine/threonine-protein kinase